MANKNTEKFGKWFLKKWILRNKHCLVPVSITNGVGFQKHIYKMWQFKPISIFFFFFCLFFVQFYPLILDCFGNYTLYFFLFPLCWVLYQSQGFFFLISTFNNKSIKNGVLYILFLVAFHEIILISWTRLRI